MIFHMVRDIKVIAVYLITKEIFKKVWNMEKVIISGISHNIMTDYFIKIKYMDLESM